MGLGLIPTPQAGLEKGKRFCEVELWGRPFDFILLPASTYVLALSGWHCKQKSLGKGPLLSQQPFFQEVLKVSSAVQDAVDEYRGLRHAIDDSIGLVNDLSEFPYSDSFQFRRDSASLGHCSQLRARLLKMVDEFFSFL